MGVTRRAFRQLDNALQALRLVETQPAVLLPPAVVRLLTDPQLLTDLGRAQTAAQLHLGLASCGDDLLGAVPLAWHPASCSLRPNANARAGTVSGGKVIPFTDVAEPVLHQFRLQFLKRFAMKQQGGPPPQARVVEGL